MTGIFMGAWASTAAGAASSDFVFAATISADASDYNLRTKAVAAGWDQVKPLKATITINSGVVVSASTVGGYAFDTGNVFPAGSTLALVNNGYILGMGGAGGNNGVSGASGQNGGPALRVQYATTVTNNGTIGGGGGGGGQGAWSEDSGYIESGGGGGGRTGRTNSAGGTPGGAAGTFAGPGAPGAGYDYADSSGGSGGGWGASGAAGATNGYLAVPPGSPGGAGGAAVVGNSFITWSATGTRLGSIG